MGCWLPTGGVIDGGCRWWFSNSISELVCTGHGKLGRVGSMTSAAPDPARLSPRTSVSRPPSRSSMWIFSVLTPFCPPLLTSTLWRRRIMSLPRFILRLIAFRILLASVNVTEDKCDGYYYQRTSDGKRTPREDTLLINDWFVIPLALTFLVTRILFLI